MITPLSLEQSKKFPLTSGRECSRSGNFLKADAATAIIYEKLRELHD